MGTPLDDHLAAIEERGFTIVTDVFDADRAGRIIDRLDGIVAAKGIGPGSNGFEGRATTRVYNLLVHGPEFESIAVDDTVLPIVEGVLDRECLLSTLSSVDIGPGESAQPIHADDQVIGIPQPHPALVCNTMWALTDFTEANGATRVVPGSHRADAPEYGTHYDSEPAEMAAGSVLIWHGSLWHGGGANTTSQRRIGIASNYCAGFVRQQENQQLGVPSEIAARFSTRLARLCGYGTYRGLIGHIDRTDPLQLLHDGVDTSMLWDHS